MRCSGSFACLMDRLLREAAGIGKLVGPGSGLVSFDQTCCDVHCRCPSRARRSPSEVRPRLTGGSLCGQHAPGSPPAAAWALSQRPGPAAEAYLGRHCHRSQAPAPCRPSSLGHPGTQTVIKLHTNKCKTTVGFALKESSSVDSVGVGDGMPGQTGVRKGFPKVVLGSQLGDETVKREDKIVPRAEGATDAVDPDLAELQTIEALRLELDGEKPRQEEEPALRFRGLGSAREGGHSLTGKRLWRFWRRNGDLRGASLTTGHTAFPTRVDRVRVPFSQTRTMVYREKYDFETQAQRQRFEGIRQVSENAVRFPKSENPLFLVQEAGKSVPFVDVTVCSVSWSLWRLLSHLLRAGLRLPPDSRVETLTPGTSECGCTSKTSEEAVRLKRGVRGGAHPAWLGDAEARRRTSEDAVRGGVRKPSGRGPREEPALLAPELGLQPPEPRDATQRVLSQAGWPLAVVTTAGPFGPCVSTLAVHERPPGVPFRFHARTAALQHRAGFCPTRQESATGVHVAAARPAPALRGHRAPTHPGLSAPRRTAHAHRLSVCNTVSRELQPLRPRAPQPELCRKRRRAVSSLTLHLEGRRSPQPEKALARHPGPAVIGRENTATEHKSPS
ncbi:unnamed protein product [Rangifer tarandus platyrhynchus]|uniref:Uncharacterized protein n=2 Tax=Rangifer tarandus platyrhynchus TaxID=3082113 RepID=A0ACB0EPW6_RANTA|nr:unnamed protein product [Rangifer tarandus platyrhynchus]CAI9702444.1 unnamed protein product [Rangifer tarandus platyrhynchus]